MSKIARLLLTGLVVFAAIAMAAYKYRDYMINPWTRDGQVNAQVVQIAPRISGPIIELPIVDNQSVSAGDLLFRIDPRTFRAALDQAEANLDQTRDRIAELEQRVAAAEAVVDQSETQISQAESQIRRTESELTEKETDLERARVLVESQDLAQRRLDQAQTAFDVAEANFEQANAQLIQARAARAQALADLESARAQLGAPGEDNAQLRAARAALETARLNLEFTDVRAAVDGYVTNLRLRLGDQAVANRPSLALIDVNSYWIEGFFRETLIRNIKPGDQAIVTLMSYPDTPLLGRVDSVGWGIAQDDGSTGENLLPNISPTFEWIRLAQRVPVRIHLEALPKGIELRVGTTASVLVRTGNSNGDTVPPAVPQALQ